MFWNNVSSTTLSYCAISKYLFIHDDESYFEHPLFAIWLGFSCTVRWMTTFLVTFSFMFCLVLVQDEIVMGNDAVPFSDKLSSNSRESG
jgi:hypothetical protein